MQDSGYEGGLRQAQVERQEDTSCARHDGGRACMASHAATPCALDDTPPLLLLRYLSLLALLLPNLSLIAYCGHSSMPSAPTSHRHRQTRPTLTQGRQNNDTHAFGQRRVLPFAFKTICAQPLPYARPLASYRMQASWAFASPFAGLLCRREGGREGVSAPF